MQVLTGSTLTDCHPILGHIVIHVQPAADHAGGLGKDVDKDGERLLEAWPDKRFTHFGTMGFDSIDPLPWENVIECYSTVFSVLVEVFSRTIFRLTFE